MTKQYKSCKQDSYLVWEGQVEVITVAYRKPHAGPFLTYITFYFCLFVYFVKCCYSQKFRYFGSHLDPGTRKLGMSLHSYLLGNPEICS